MAEELKSDFDSKTNSQIYVCSFPGCLSNFSRKDRLTIHFRTHSGEKPFVCDEEGCDKSYARAAHLKRHCETAHKQGHDLPKHICPLEGCGQEFTNKSNLKRHVELHAQKQYKCNSIGCTKSFRKHSQLRVHENEHSNILPYVCSAENCNRSFKTSSQLNRHQKVHEGYQCTEEGCTAHFEKWTQLWKHKTVAHKADFKCDQCGKVFSQQNRLSRHLKIHSEDRQVFECPRPDCSRVYLDMKSLKSHISSYHDGVRFTCADCQRTFASKQKLIQHARLHDPDRPPPKKKSRKGQKKKSMALKLSQLGLHEDEDSQSSETMDEETVQKDTVEHRKVPSANGNKDRPHTLTGPKDFDSEVSSYNSEERLDSNKELNVMGAVLSSGKEKCLDVKKGGIKNEPPKLSNEAMNNILLGHGVEFSKHSVFESVGLNAEEKPRMYVDDEGKVSADNEIELSHIGGSDEARSHEVQPAELFSKKIETIEIGPSPIEIASMDVYKEHQSLAPIVTGSHITPMECSTFKEDGTALNQTEVSIDRSIDLTSEEKSAIERPISAEKNRNKDSRLKKECTVSCPFYCAFDNSTATKDSLSVLEQPGNTVTLEEKMSNQEIHTPESVDILTSDKKICSPTNVSKSFEPFTAEKNISNQELNTKSVDPIHGIEPRECGDITLGLKSNCSPVGETRPSPGGAASQFIPTGVQENKAGTITIQPTGVYVSRIVAKSSN